METKNATTTSFIILAFSMHSQTQSHLFILFLLIYVLTVAENLCLLIMVYADYHLHTPMYFFLSNLAFLDICYISVSVPKLLDIFLTGHHAISFAGCITQMYFYASVAATEFLLLSIMAYDRYVAICKPLYYMNIVNPKLCVTLSVDSWSFGLLMSIPIAVLVSRLSFCNSLEVNHLLCDVKPLLKLSCTNTHAAETAVFVEALACSICSFLLIVSSYACIIVTIVKINSTAGRQKAFSTCSSHLTVLSLVFVILLSTYVRPSSTYSPQSLDNDKLLTLLYSVFIPMVNPIIYSLRNKEVKHAVIRIQHKYFVFNTK